MSALKATPGPWLVKQAFVADEFRVMREERGVGWMRVARLDRDKAGGFSRADAYLIAAAPELYEALDGFLSMFLGVDERETVEEYNARAKAAIDKARAALAKARGEQQ